MKSSDKEHTPILETILKQTMTEEELYHSYFRKEFWSVEEFTCLMVGITPERFRDVLARISHLMDEKRPPFLV